MSEALAGLVAFILGVTVTLVSTSNDTPKPSYRCTQAQQYDFDREMVNCTSNGYLKSYCYDTVREAWCEEIKK
jgi:hypothetical protein